MSDIQVWDIAWTADDASYDYLNPESLALNRGGTSLTNSNLKLWYPMQDGHRGNQSYVLDASNTGLGDEVVTNGGFNGDFFDEDTGETDVSKADVTEEEYYKNYTEDYIESLDPDLLFTDNCNNHQEYQLESEECVVIQSEEIN